MIRKLLLAHPKLVAHSVKLEHFGFVGLASSEVFGLHSALFWINLILMLAGLCAALADSFDLLGR